MIHNPIFLSIVVPAFNCARQLTLCLQAIFACGQPGVEVILVDDGSTDSTAATAALFPVSLLHTGGRRGPAFARNLGAKSASGEVLLFLDSDVCLQSGALQKIVSSFAADPALDALMGSYDSHPASPDFLSQYRNLMHAFVHQNGETRASTFWSGCGAIRRAVFLQHSGFDEAFGRPAIEDIELGYRLTLAGRKLVLDSSIQVTHLKQWTFWSLVKTDVLDRGIPWTELILRDRFMPDDLNLQLSQRVSVALVFVLAVLSALMAIQWRSFFLLPLFVIVFTLLGRWWCEFSAPEKPRSASAILLAVVGVTSVAAYFFRMPGLIPPLLLSPGLLLIQHRYAARGSKPPILRVLGLIYAAGSILLALVYLPSHRLMFPCFLLVATLALLNRSFYIFLAGKRGIPFMIAALPFHALFHFYNGISFGVGVLRFAFLSSDLSRPNPAANGGEPESVFPGRVTVR